MTIKAKDEEIDYDTDLQYLPFIDGWKVQIIFNKVGSLFRE